jgi:hypothetical protein
VSDGSQMERHSSVMSNQRERDRSCIGTLGTLGMRMYLGPSPKVDTRGNEPRARSAQGQIGIAAGWSTGKEIRGLMVGGADSM